MRFHLLKKNYYLSIGENCLADDILSRNGLKTFSSPYSSGRSNIEYILAFEKERFSDFTNSDYLKYEYAQSKKVVRNKKYVSVDNSYNCSCINGFEFTHHDVINKKNIREAINRRSQRMLNLKHKNLTLLYHHRYCESTDWDLLIKHLQELSAVYYERGNTVNIFLFYQILVPSEEYRRVEHYNIDNIHIYQFYTLKEWAGDNNDIFWAKCDDDLLSDMINDMKHL